MEQIGDRIGQWLEYGQSAGNADASSQYEGDCERDSKVNDCEGAGLGETVCERNAHDGNTSG